MNNKGFAITTILYGIMVLFCILLVSLLGLLSSYRKTQELLIDSTNGTREIVKTETTVTTINSCDELTDEINGMVRDCRNPSNCVDKQADEIREECFFE